MCHFSSEWSRSDAYAPGVDATRIADEVLTWEGVSAHEHRFGGVEFRLGKRELGHLHGDPPRLADLPFQKGIRDMRAWWYGSL